MADLLRARRVLRTAALAAALTVGSVAVPSVASAHSLESSTLSVHVGNDAVDATITVALESVDGALGTDHTTATGADAYADVVDYLDEHFTVTGADGAAWVETWSEPVRETVEGIDSVSVQVAVDPAGADPSSFVLAYDAVVEADPAHEAVVVLTDAAGEVSTAGVLTSTDPALAVGGGAGSGLLDLVGHGLHHVLEGADHLLFLVTLLLVAPLVASAGRWRPGGGALRTAGRVLGTATAFTVGHSLTLGASALGGVSLPSGPVEVLIAASVGVSAVHALRPLVRSGEVLLAGGFGLVHGLAFAGILAGLGLEGSASLLDLLAFNVGVELAQVVTIALVLPSLHLASRTGWYPALRVGLAVGALAVSVGWALDRLGLLANPFAPVEEAAVSHLGAVAAGLAVVALACRLLPSPGAVQPPGCGRLEA